MIQDLAIILIVAGVVTLLFKRLRQPVVLGYIVAGFLVSAKMPYMPSVADKSHSVEEWAEIGVMFLMFGLGLEFSIKKILKQGMAPVKSALVIISSMMALGFGIGRLFSWTDMNCLFLGGMLAMSSTTIIYKAFDDLDLHHFNFASRVMSVLILEDIFGIVMMVVLQAVSGGGGGSISDSIVGIIIFLFATFGLGIALVPMFLRSVRRLMNGETLLIVSLGLCCLVTYISVELGFSAALGAFLMGSVLAETSEVERIHKVVEPVKNLFGAIFFVSVGMLVDPHILMEYWLPILVLVLTIIAGQSVLGSLGFFLGGQTVRGALRSGFSMTQIGEFSFIIATLGLTLGVISDFLYPIVVAVSVITTFTTPYMIKAAEKITALIPQNLGDYKFTFAKHTSKTPSIVGRAGERFYIQSKINAGSLPQNAHRIMNREIHISEISLPEDSMWIGKTLKELQLGTIFSVHLSSILRDTKRINIPTADERLLSHDRLQVVGSDEDLTLFTQAMQAAVYPKDDCKTEDDMKLIQRTVTPQSIFFGMSLRELNLRERYSAMLVGMETGQEKLSVVSPDYKFRDGDIVWIVCESKKEYRIK